MSEGIGAMSEVEQRLSGSPATHVLLEAVGRSVGARRALVLPVGSRPHLPEPRRGLWRREETHILAVHIPASDPPRELVLELPRPPAPEDRLVVEALVNVVGASEVAHPVPGPRGPELVALLSALSAPDPRRYEAMLRATLRLAGSTAGALCESGEDAQAWTLGPGRVPARVAARDACETGDGVVEVAGRRFLVRKLTLEGRTVGGLALEGGRDSPALRGAVTVLALSLGRGAERASEQEPSAADLAAALGVIPAPALALDAEGRLLAVSPEAQQVFGLTEFDLGSAVSARLERWGLGSVGSGAALPAHVVVGDRWLEPETVALPSGGRLFVFLDRSREEEERVARERLVAAMSHELRTPIVGVKALLEVLKRPAGKRDPERTSQLIDEGQREIGRLERLVEDLLLAARIATGGIVARPDTIELRPVVDDVVKQVSPRYPSHRFVVGGGSEGLADPVLLRHALWHLIDNAAKFSPTGEEVRIGIGTQGGEAELAVSDRGAGIFSGDIPNLFKPYKRLDTNAISAQGGAGMGLYLAKAAVEAQGGSISVRSRLGKGSTFSVRLALPHAREH